MNRQKIENELSDMIRPIVEPLGFKKRKSGDGLQYFKKTEFGYNEISLLVWSYETLFYVGLGFSTRFSDINNIYNPFSSYVESAYETNSTLGAGINSFGYNSEGKIKVETESDLDIAIEILKDVLLKHGLAFFDDFTSIAAFDKELNRENRPANLYLHDIDRSFVGITVAALNKNPNFSHWEKFYRNRLEKASQARKEKYESLVKYLKETILHV